MRGRPTVAAAAAACLFLAAAGLPGTAANDIAVLKQAVDALRESTPDVTAVVTVSECVPVVEVREDVRAQSRGRERGVVR